MFFHAQNETDVFSSEILPVLGTTQAGTECWAGRQWRELKIFRIRSD